MIPMKMVSQWAVRRMRQALSTTSIQIITLKSQLWETPPHINHYMPRRARRTKLTCTRWRHLTLRPRLGYVEAEEWKSLPASFL